MIAGRAAAIPDGICVRCAVRRTYGPRADYCAPCRRELDLAAQRRSLAVWRERHRAELAAQPCVDCGRPRGIRRGTRRCAECSSARELAGDRERARARRAEEACVDCGDPRGPGSRTWSPRCVDCDIEHLGPPRCSLARPRPKTRRMTRTCAVCDAPYVGRSGWCVRCRAVILLAGGVVSCPLDLCRMCGMSLGPRVAGGPRRFCRWCRTIRYWPVMVDGLVRRLEFMEVRARMHRWMDAEAVSGVDWWRPPQVPAHGGEPVRICEIDPAHGRAVYASRYCFDCDVRFVLRHPGMYAPRPARRPPPVVRPWIGWIPGDRVLPVAAVASVGVWAVSAASTGR